MTPGLLPRRPRPRHDETPWSYASRLAWANGASSIEHMLIRWGTRVFDVANGRPEALRLLGSLSGTTGPSVANVLERDGAVYRVCGERLGKHNLVRRRFVICPVCAAEDVATGRGSEPLRTHGRFGWAIEALRTCAVHETPLREYEPATTIGGIEFAWCVEKNLEAILADACRARHRARNDGELYLAGRLGLGLRGDVPFLDALPFQAAERLLDIVGSVVVDGPAAVRRSLPPENACLALAEGFAVMQDGADGLRRTLGRLLDDTLADPDANWGLRPMLGRLHDSFIPREAGPEVDSVREIIAEFVAERMPRFQTGFTVGRQVDNRLLSIRAASREFGWHPVTLRKVLMHFGLIGSETDGLMDERVVFEREAFEAAIPPYAETFSRNGLAKHLGLSRVHALKVIPTYIEPLYGPDEASGLGEFRYTRAAADDFMDRLFVGSVDFEVAGDGMVDLNQACKRTCSSVTDVLDLALSGNLAWKGRVAGRRDYGALLLDLAEICGHLRGEDHGGLAAYKAARIMGVSPEVVAKLMEIGALPSFEAIDPVNRCPVRVTRPEDIAAFQAKYITLKALAAERGERLLRTKRTQTELNIEAAFDPGFVGVSIYPRLRNGRSGTLSENQAHCA